MAIWNRAPLPPPPRRQRTDRRALLASAESLQGSAAILSGVGDSKAKTPKQPWQQRFWDAYDEVGEMHYACAFYGKCFSRVTLEAGVMDRESNVIPLYDDEGKPVEEVSQPLADETTRLLQGLRSNIGGQAQLMSGFGANLAGAGEVQLLGVDEESDAGTTERYYEALSTEELQKKNDGGYTRKASPGSGDKRDYSEDIYVLRIWNPHPRYSALADSSFRPVLDIAEELVLLTRAVRATVTSRLAGAGVLYVNNRLDYPDDDTAGEGTEEQDPFARDLITAMTTPIHDRGSASAVVPMVVRGDLTPDEAMKYFSFTKNFDSYPSIALRREAVERLAQGIDLPVEVITGHRQTTFANAFAIDEATFKVHIEPLLELLVDALTIGYLRPMLVAADADPLQVARMAVRFDASELVIPPDMSDAADAAHDRWTISDSTHRRSKGFTESDKPDDKEIAQRIAIRVAAGGGTEPQAPPSGDDEPPPPPPPPSEPTDPGDPDAPPEGGASLVDRIHAATEFAIERAVTRAGNRLRAKVNGKAGVRERLAQVDAASVAQTLGPKAVTALLSEAELFEAEFEVLGRKIDEWAQDELHTDPGGVTLRVLTLAEEAAHRRLYSATAGIDRRDIQAAVW